MSAEQAPLILAQNPAERFDVVLADGTPTGRSKQRAAVHRDGDWHRSVHVWIAGVDGDAGPFLLFQRRSSAKDTWPGRLDATVGGHFAAGEDLSEALREVEEELGIAPPVTSLLPLGVRVAVSETQPGIVDRELQTVLLLPDVRPLHRYEPQPAEVAALIRFRLAPLLAFLGGDATSVAGDLLVTGETDATTTWFDREAFIPSVDRYFYRVAIAASAALRGDQYVSI